MTVRWLKGEPMDPFAVPAEPIPPLPGTTLIARGASTLFSGPTGTGRSALVEALVYDAALAGSRCAYLGSEITLDEFSARAAVIAERRDEEPDAEKLAEHARYLDLASTLVEAWGDPGAWVEGVVESYDLIVIDPLSAAASALDGDFDTSNAEYVRFYDRLLQPLTARGVAVVLVDNIGHSQDARKRAKGASAKGDKADVTIACRAHASPRALALQADKVRSVLAPFRPGEEWLFAESTQRVTRYDGAAPGESKPTSFRPTNVMAKVSELVARDEGLGKKAIRTAIGSNNRVVDLALDLLISEGFVEVRQEGSKHGHYQLKPYVQAEDEPAVLTVLEPCSEGAQSTLPSTVLSVPLPEGGHAAEHGGNGTTSEANRASVGSGSPYDPAGPFA